MFETGERSERGEAEAKPDHSLVTDSDSAPGHRSYAAVDRLWKKQLHVERVSGGDGAVRRNVLEDSSNALGGAQSKGIAFVKLSVVPVHF